MLSSSDSIKLNDGFHRLSDWEYHKLPFLNKSTLDKINKSPAHYIWQKEHPVDFLPTPQMLFGTAFHAMVLEPDKFKETYIRQLRVDRRTKEGKIEYQNYLLENKNKIQLSDEDFLRLDYMYSRLGNNEEALGLLTRGKAEVTALWQDSRLDVRCKAKMDYVRPDHIILDLKTTHNSSAEGFVKSVIDYRYYVQAAFYISAYDHITGVIPKFKIIACETDAPYNVQVYDLNEEWIELGFIAFYENIETYLDCHKTNTWPGYKKSHLKIPKWFLYKQNNN